MAGDLEQKTAATLQPSTQLLLLCVAVLLCLKWRKGLCRWKNQPSKKEIHTQTFKNEALDLDETPRVGKKKDDTDWVWRKRMAVEVSLDPLTANPYLTVGKDSVSWTEMRQQREWSVQGHFDEYPAVLGRIRGPPPGQYWEVDVGDKRHWEVGVALEKVPRRGVPKVSPQSGLWVLARWDTELKALEEEEALLRVPMPRIVGVYVDLLLQQVSFFDANRRSLLYRFKERFDGSIVPFFSPGNSDKEAMKVLTPAQTRSGFEHST